jgi:hypothetical protein
LTVQRAEPLPGYHNFFDRFKLRTAQFDGSGRNPTDINCIVLSVSETDQKAKLDPGTPWSSIGDLQ